MMKGCIKSFPLLVVLFSATNLFCADIGSDSAVTRFNYQVTVNDGDRIAGFAALESGFKLASDTVSGTFDSFFEVSGTVDLAGGNLFLTRDLIFRDTASFYSLGNIYGNNHSMEFSPTITAFPFQCAAGANGGNGTCFCEVDYLDAKNLTGDVVSVDFNYSSSFVAVGVHAAGLKSLAIYEAETGALVDCYTGDQDFTANVNSVRWHPSANLVAIGRDTSAGSEVRVFELNPNTCVLTEKGSLEVSTDNVRALSWRPPNGDYLAVGSDDPFELHIYSVSAAGVITTPYATRYNAGNIAYDAIDWSPDGSQLVYGGFQASTGRLRILDFDDTPGSESLSLNVGTDFTNAVASSVDWNKTYSAFIVIGLEDTVNDSIRIFQHEGATNYLAQVSSFPGATPATYAVRWNHNGLCLGAGSDVGDGSSGIEEFQTFDFDPVTFALSTESQFDLGTEVRGIGWSPDGHWVGIGTESDQVQLYGASCTPEGTFTFEDLNLSIANDVLLQSAIVTFTGKNVIRGNNNCLTFCSRSTWVIAPNSSLEFRDITVKGIWDGNLYCTDHTSTISFHNVEMILEGDYVFSHGKFAVLADLLVAGDGYSFVYETVTTSTVWEDGRLILDHGVTFSYAPALHYHDLLQFADATSQLVLRGATLYSTPTGIHLSNGTIVFDGEPVLASGGTVEAEALVIENNMQRIWIPGTLVDLQGPIVTE